MPLIKDKSDAARSKNIAAEIRSGKPRDQALAIAYRVQRDAKKKGYADGGGLPYHARAEARGMERAGMIRSPVAGRTDKIPMGVQPGSYVIPADTVSGVGQGNSLSGANALNQLFKMGPYGTKPATAPRAAPRPRMRAFADGGGVGDVDIVAAGGEYVLPPEKVMEIGGGDLAHGHSVLDAMVAEIRKNTVTRLKKLPAPRKS